MLSRRASWVFGLSDLATGALILVGVFLGLPARVMAVDLAAVVLASLELASGAGLLVVLRGGTSPAGTLIALRLAIVAAIAMLAAGLLLVTTLALTASWLSGVYGPVGTGGAVILVLVAALVLPYLVVLPTVKLVWCTR